MKSVEQGDGRGRRVVVGEQVAYIVIGISRETVGQVVGQQPSWVAAIRRAAGWRKTEQVANQGPGSAG